MIEKTAVFVAVIETPSPYSEFNLLGRKPSEYVYKAISEFSFMTLSAPPDSAEARRALSGEARFLAVIGSDMPLITAEGILACVEYMTKNGMAELAIGKGKIYDNRREGGSAAKKTFNFCDFLSLDGSAALGKAYNELRQRINAGHIAAGVIIPDASAVYIDDTAKIEAGALIRPHSVIEGESVIGAQTTVGPSALIRGSKIGRGCRIGDFVEIKNSVLGDGVKSAHLAYIGDAEVGAHTNIGCGTVFCNYDGKNKHRTIIGENSFIGANVNLVAPLTLGARAFVAAGSTVTDDAPEYSFIIARERQTTKPRKK